jgi:Alkaline phytoceramidase (aPHC).
MSILTKSPTTTYKNTSFLFYLASALTLPALPFLLFLAPIPQDPHYHSFAGDFPFWGIENFSNLVSNFFFCLAGVLGFYRLKNLPTSPEKLRWQLFYFSIFFVGIGSGYYHYRPTTQTLFWDRLPMTMGFMILSVNFLGERFPLFRRWDFWGFAVFFGMYSVLYWHLSEIFLKGDLRPYIFVQYATMLLVFLTLLKVSHPTDPAYWLLLIGYSLAKVCELGDHPIYEWTNQLLSGHVLKHILSGIALCVFFPTKTTFKQEKRN